MLRQIETIFAIRLISASRRAPSTINVILVLGWILVVWSLVGTYEFARWIRSEPRFAGLADLIIAPALLAVFVMGIPATSRLVADHRRFAFLQTLPLSPTAILTHLCLERCSKVSVLVLFTGAYVGGLYSLQFWPSMVVILSFMVAATLMLGVLQVLTLLTIRAISGYGGPKIILATALLAAILYALLTWTSSPSANGHILEAILARINSHILLRLVGLDGIAALSRIDIASCRRLAIMGGILLRVALCCFGIFVVLRCFSERLSEAGTGARSRMLTFSVRLIHGLLHVSRPGWVVHGALELALLLRQGSVVVSLCALGMFATLTIARLWAGDSLMAARVTPLVAVLAAMFIASDGIWEVLRQRWPYQLYRCCGADPGEYAVGLAFTTSCSVALIVLACAPLVVCQRGLAICAYSILSAVILGVSEATLATLASIYLYPIYPRLGLIGKIKAGAILLISAWLILLMGSPLIVLPPILVSLFWLFKKQAVGSFLWRRIWSA